MEAADWDARYAATDLVWSAAPNVWVEELVSGMPPGRALDIAAGEGRNALWLVEQGWEVEAVDFSRWPCSGSPTWPPAGSGSVRRG